MNCIEGAQFKECLKSAYEKLNNNKDHVNALNVFPVPDGDTGTNMSLTMESALAAVEKTEDQAEAIGKALGMGSLMGARGNSGVILSQLCRGLAEGMKGKDKLFLSDLPLLFQCATDKAYKAVMKPTEGTILTVAKSMSDYAVMKVSEYQDMGDFLTGILFEGNQTLQETPTMLAELKEAGVVDAGGQGLVYLLAGFVEQLTGQDTSEILAAEGRKEEADMAVEDLAARYGFHEEFLIKVTLTNLDVDKLSKQVEKLGHIHSTIETEAGYLLRISSDVPDRLIKLLLKESKILSLDLISRDYDPVTFDKDKDEDLADENLKDFGFVAVCSGSGFESLFKQLLVDEVIEGGQTMNPSTKDIYEAVTRVSAKTVFILPNNKNIIMAANMVQELEDHKKVIVIPSKTVPQGVEALFNFSDDVDAEENARIMTASMEDVKTGQITYAIRDTRVNDLDIRKDDYIGILDGEIVATGQDQSQLVIDVLSRMVDDESSLINIYPGEGVEEASCELLCQRIEDRYPDLDVDCQPGHQPVYSYIFSVE